MLGSCAGAIAGKGCMGYPGSYHHFTPMGSWNFTSCVCYLSPPTGFFNSPPPHHCYEFSFPRTLSKTHAWPACLCMLRPLLKRPFSMCQRHVFHTCLFLASSLLLTCFLPYVHHTSSMPTPHSLIVYIVAYRVVYSLASLCSLITKPLLL